MYYGQVWDNFNNLFEVTPWPWLTRREFFEYQKFIYDVENISSLRRALFSAGFRLTNEASTVERYVEILVNLILLMEYDLNEVHNHMTEADVLKTFSDYTYDGLNIALGIKFGRLGSLAFSTADMLIDNINSYRFFTRMLLDYETSRNFLNVIIQYSNNEKLVEGARILRNNIDRVMQHQLDNFNDMVGRFGMYLGKDVFLDTIILEMIADPSHLALSAVDQFALETLAEGYAFLGAASLVRDTAVLIADLISGISNVLNRVAEMQAMYDINQALIRNTENLRRNIHSGDDLDNIERVVQSMQYMLYVNARGDYLLYQTAMRDGHFLSLLLTDRQQTERWYSLVKENIAYWARDLKWFWPQREWFRRDEAYLGIDLENNKYLQQELKDLLLRFAVLQVYFDETTTEQEILYRCILSVTASALLAVHPFTSIFHQLDGPIPDPLGLYRNFFDLDSGYGYSFARFDADEVDWILEHIFNRTPSRTPDVFEVINPWWTEYIYYSNGYYYGPPWEGLGGPRDEKSLELRIIDTLPNNTFYVEFIGINCRYWDTIPRTLYALVQYKTIGNDSFWSFHSVTKAKEVPRIDMYELWNIEYVEGVLELIGEPDFIEVVHIQRWCVTTWVEIHIHSFSDGLTIDVVMDEDGDFLFVLGIAVNYKIAENKQRIHFNGIDGLSTRDDVIAIFGLPAHYIRDDDYKWEFYHGAYTLGIAFVYDESLTVNRISLSSTA